MIFNPYAKSNPIRSKRYREFIASIPCLVSNQKADPHHESFGEGCTSGKPSDLWCLPLSKEWHTDNTRSRHRHRGGWQAFYEEHNINPWLECLKFINYFFANGGKL
jgi:hypothetical protein